MSAHTTDSLAAQREAAARLVKLTGGKVHIEPASDHTFDGYLFEPREVDFLRLDGRKRTPLHQQLAAELRRVAGVFERIAARVEAKAG